MLRNVTFNLKIFKTVMDMDTFITFNTAFVLFINLRNI